nr:hypothetical protein [uncultured Moellerella sp.]
MRKLTASILSSSNLRLTANQPKIIESKLSFAYMNNKFRSPNKVKSNNQNYRQNFFSLAIKKVLTHSRLLFTAATVLILNLGFINNLALANSTGTGGTISFQGAIWVPPCENKLNNGVIETSCWNEKNGETTTVKNRPATLNRYAAINLLQSKAKASFYWINTEKQWGVYQVTYK